MPILAESITDNPKVVKVLKKYGLMTADGNWRVVTVEHENQGAGPLLDLAVVEKFASLDVSRSGKVLDWLLLQAGGGQVAYDESLGQLAWAKAAWVKNRTDGIGDGGESVPPMTKEQAEATWAEFEPQMQETILPADQDMLEYYANNRDTRIFGYTRSWPGYKNIYETVYTEAKTFLQNMTLRTAGQSRLSVINQARLRRANDPTNKDPYDKPYKPVDPILANYATVAEVEAINGEFTRYFKKSQEASNVQFIGKETSPGGQAVYKKGIDVKLYEDPIVTVYIPATAAAAMQVGFDNWCMANKTEFADAFHHRSPKTPNWTNYHKNYGPLAVIHVKPDLVEPSRPRGDVLFLSCKRIAVLLKGFNSLYLLAGVPDLVEPYPNVEFFDRENRNHPAPVRWPELRDRLAQVYDAQTEQPIGEPVLTSIRAAMAEIGAWVKQLKAGDIKISVYERLASVLVYDLLHG